jgi:hypothetical protein
MEIANGLRSLIQTSPIELDGCQVTMIAISSILNHRKCYLLQMERSLRFQSSRADTQVSMERRGYIGLINAGKFGTDFRGISVYIL